MPKWRNWQTQQTQNLPLCEQRAGSTPAFGTIADTARRAFSLRVNAILLGIFCQMRDFSCAAIYCARTG